MSDIDFYYAPMSSSISIHWALEELDLIYNPIKLQFDEKMQLSFEGTYISKEDFIKLNPNCQVPLLVYKDTPIYESGAILLFLGEKFGVFKKLYPKDVVERAITNQWVFWGQTSFGVTIRQLFENSNSMVPEDEKNEIQLMKATQKIHFHLNNLNQSLSNKTFLQGNFNIADIMLATSTAWLEMLGVELNDCPNIQNWLEECKMRPAFKKAHQT